MNQLSNRCGVLWAAVVIVVGAAGVTARGADMVDNPQYQSWAKHKPGTSINLHNDTSAMGMSMIQQVVQTLTDVTPDKATVEIAVTMEMAGQKHDVKQKHDIPAKVE